VSTPGLALPRPLPRPDEVLPVALPVGGALLLGVALGAGIPALALVALLPFAVAIVLNATAATIAFAFAFYLNLPVIAASHGLPGAASGLFVLMLGVPLVRHLIVRRDPVVLTPAVGLMVAYLVSLVVSAVVTQTPASQAANAITTFLAEGLLLVVLVINAVRTPRVLRLFIWALLAAGALMGLLSIIQELTHSYSNTFGGLAKVNQQGFGVGEGPLGKVVRPRLAGPIGEQNRYAQVLLVLLPLAIGRMKVERTLLLRGLAAVAGTLIVCGVLLTFSRGAAVALVLLLIAMVATGFVALRHVVALAAVLAGLVFTVTPDYIHRVQTLGEAGDTAALQSDQADQALKGRATENLAALNAFRDHPILGVGPDQFFRRYSTQYGNELGLRFLEENRRAHNLYLEIGADLGVVGLLAFLSIVVVTLAHLWRLARWWQGRRPELFVLAMSALLSLVAYLASGIFLQLSFQRYFWILIAIANAAIWILRHEPVVTPHAAAPAEGRPAVAAAPAA
jgi:putative inorganic carbon (hco3(-)) transporter